MRTRRRLACSAGSSINKHGRLDLHEGPREENSEPGKRAQNKDTERSMTDSIRGEDVMGRQLKTGLNESR
jgi:hypothetical protein